MYEPTSCILFHGPGAEQEGYKHAQSFGRLIPFTGSNLKKDGARELVSLLSQRPVGDRRACVFVGPVDEIAAATSDVLLKTIEDFDPTGTRPFLWAWDLGGVSSTLRSRCVLRFCPGVDARTEGFASSAGSVLKSYLEGDWVTLIEEVKSLEDLDGLLRATVEHLAPKVITPSGDPRYVSLWESLRDLSSKSTTLTAARVVAAFLLADERSLGGISS